MLLTELGRRMGGAAESEGLVLMRTSESAFFFAPMHAECDILIRQVKGGDSEETREDGGPQRCRY
jgi:hypothetical protein